MPPTTVHRGREPYGGDQLAGSIPVGGFLPRPLKASRGKYWPLTADITWSATKRHFFLVVASSLAALLVAEVGLRIFSATPKQKQNLFKTNANLKNLITKIYIKNVLIVKQKVLRNVQYAL